MYLRFLKLPSFPTVDHLWSNLAETRRQRRRLKADKLEYASFFGIYTQAEFDRTLVNLRLREKCVENLIKTKKYFPAFPR